MTRSLTKNRQWQQLLGAYSVARYPAVVKNPALDFVVDWGNKRQSLIKDDASLASLPVLRIEDGLIRSMGLAQRDDTPFSILYDDQAIYYDTRRPSRFENLLNGIDNQNSLVPGLTFSNGCTDAAHLLRARQCINFIVKHHITKYNHLDDCDLGIKERHRVLVVDQTVDDLSVAGAGASASSFEKMLDAALSLDASVDVIVKQHPDVLAGKKKPYLNAAQLRQRGVRVIDQAVNPISVLKQVDEVYVVSSQLGFEALMCEKPVTCFAQPFYSGWGLTVDRQPFDKQRRQCKQTLEAIFVTLYFDCCRYFDPLTLLPCELECVLSFIALQREMYHRNRGVNYCVDFPPWKRAYLRRFLYSPWGDVVFCRTLSQSLAGKNNRIICWASEVDDKKILDLKKSGVEIVQAEDGFVRSAGLGKYYIAPLSLVFDSNGIYYDHSRACDLELLLKNSDFSDDELARADKLVEQIVAQKLSKYNVGVNAIPPEVLAAVEQARLGNKKIVLVPGQVANDASIRAGCTDVSDDGELLSAVRAREAGSLIIYKPHPDVVSGNAPGYNWQADKVADLVIAESDINNCLGLVDEVHTMTSLTGFEALLRALPVITYGGPFYAGWGLTQDRLSFARRHRQLTLAQLVAGTLIRYPRYFNYAYNCFVSPEQALTELGLQNSNSGRELKAGKCLRLVRKCRNLLYSLAYGFSRG